MDLLLITANILYYTNRNRFSESNQAKIENGLSLAFKAYIVALVSVAIYAILTAQGKV